ncbi:MAG: invasion associated locus B family protein [Pseudomonadota bacterium]
MPTHFRDQPTKRDFSQTVLRLFGGLFLALCAAAFAIPPAQAQGPTFVEQTRDWDVFNVTIEGAKACFIVSPAQTYDPMPESRHGDVFFYMTRRPAANVNAEPLLLVGYSFREGSQVNVSVGSSNFVFLTQGPRAFINDPSQGDALLAAMRAGSTMRVTGTSSRGTAVTYGFSLSGVTAGSNRTAAECAS